MEPLSFTHRHVPTPGALLVLGLALVGCAKNDPPEKRTTKAAAAVPSARPRSAEAQVTLGLASFPSGSAFIGRPADCRVTMLGRVPEDRWDAKLGDCGGILEVATAPNSMAFARTASELVAFSVDGKKKWAFEVARVPPELAAIAVTLDSMVVTLTSDRSAVAYKADGQLGYTFNVEGAERFRAAPTRSEAEGVLLTTDAAIYSVTPDGSIRFRNSFAPSAPE